jgi:hypothetical protein
VHGTVFALPPRPPASAALFVHHHHHRHDNNSAHMSKAVVQISKTCAPEVTLQASHMTRTAFLLGAGLRCLVLPHKVRQHGALVVTRCPTTD